MKLVLKKFKFTVSKIQLQIAEAPQKQSIKNRKEVKHFAVAVNGI